MGSCEGKIASAVEGKKEQMLGLITRPSRPSAFYPIQRLTIQVLEVMPRIIRRRSMASKRRAAAEEVPARQDRAFEMAEVAREQSERNNMLHMCGFILRCHRRCTSCRRRANHEFATRCAPAA
jgi:hypothetical protein